jgi:hypothetical protein
MLLEFNALLWVKFDEGTTVLVGKFNSPCTRHVKRFLLNGVEQVWKLRVES